MKITTIDVRGKKFEVDVNEAGMFGTSYNGEWIKAANLEDLRGKLLRVTKAEQAKIAIRLHRMGWEENTSRRVHWQARLEPKLAREIRRQEKRRASQSVDF
jgi:hypothetical protein